MGLELWSFTLLRSRLSKILELWAALAHSPVALTRWGDKLWSSTQWDSQGRPRVGWTVGYLGTCTKTLATALYHSSYRHRKSSAVGPWIDLRSLPIFPTIPILQGSLTTFAVLKPTAILSPTANKGALCSPESLKIPHRNITTLPPFS